MSLATITLLAEAAPGATLWEEYVGLITDPAHWLMEITLIGLTDIVIGMLLWPRIKAVVIKRHDARYGHTVHGDHGEQDEAERSTVEQDEAERDERDGRLLYDDKPLHYYATEAAAAKRTGMEQSGT